MNQFTFQEQNSKQEHKDGVQLCLKYLWEQGMSAKDVSNDPNYFEQGTDILVNSPDGEYNIDVKTDEQMWQTQNIVAELMEICGIEKIKIGWVYKKLDAIYYLNWQTKELYAIPLNELKEIIFSKPRKSFSAYHPTPIRYFTLGVLIPTIELEKYKIKLCN